MAAVESNDVSVDAAEGLQKEEASRPLYTNRRISKRQTTATTNEVF
jgi:hypothetical protein